MKSSIYRKALARMLRQLERQATGPIQVAEIGVHRGGTSRELLAMVPRLHLLMIDSWAPWQSQDPTRRIDAMAKMSAEEHLTAMQQATAVANEFPGKATIINKPSAEAARDIADGSLHAVFIDADHSKAGTLADMEVWFPKVKQGGLFSGHDYGKWHFPGVAEAVNEWFGKAGREFEVNEPAMIWYATV